VEDRVGKILLAVVIVFVLLFVVRLANPRKKKTDGKASTQPPQSQQQLGAEPMLACAHCKTLVPRSEAVVVHGLAYCSPEHARLGQRS
jgi:uncharacterized protein